MCEIDWAIIVNGIIASAAVITLFFSVRTYRSNRKFLQKQQFESMFFNMMNQLEDIVSKLTLEKRRRFEHTDEGTTTYQDISENKTGRDVFQSFYERSRIRINDTNLLLKIRRILSKEVRSAKEKSNFRYLNNYIEDGDQVMLEVDFGINQVISNIGMRGYEKSDNIHILDHYFRYLYRIMKFVDEADYLERDKKYIDERYKYMGILRATLSPYELVFLFYNDLSKYGKEKVKPLIERYSMFKSLRPELLANTMRDYELNLIEDEYKNDYDRYIAFDEKDNGYLRYNQSVKYKEHNKHLLNKW